jgi:hypothetical protein
MRLKHSSRTVGGQQFMAEARGVGRAAGGGDGKQQERQQVFHARLIGAHPLECQRRAVAAAPSRA